MCSWYATWRLKLLSQVAGDDLGRSVPGIVCYCIVIYLDQPCSNSNTMEYKCLEGGFHLSLDPPFFFVLVLFSLSLGFIVLCSLHHLHAYFVPCLVRGL